MKEDGCFRKGPVGMVQSLVRELGGRREGRVVHIGTLDVPLEAVEEETRVQHIWREAIRIVEWSKAARRRHDMEGLELVHWQSLWAQQKSFLVEDAALLRAIQSGGLCNTG